MHILITGTSRGIGYFLANYYLNKGFYVFGCNRDGKSTITHDNYKHYACDLQKPSSIKDFIHCVRKDTKVIDVLINNAGIAGMNHALMTPIDMVKSICETNYVGTYAMSSEASRLLRKSDNASIINFTTVASPLYLEGEAAYAASKSAVETLTRIFAKELSPYKIRVNAIGPTPIATDLVAGVPSEKMSQLIAQQAIKRMGEREDIVNVCDFFIQPESNFITGQIIYLGGVF